MKTSAGVAAMSSLTKWRWSQSEAFFLADALRVLGYPLPDPAALMKGLREVRLRRCPAREVLLGAGGRWSDVFIIHRGRVRFLRRPPDGRATRVEILGKGAVFGELGLGQAAPAPALAVTAAPTDLFVLTGAEFRFLMDSSPSFRRRMETLAGAPPGSA